MTGDGPKVYNPKPSDQFFGKGTLNTEGPFVDVRRRVAPGLFTDIDRSDLTLSQISACSQHLAGVQLHTNLYHDS